MNSFAPHVLVVAAAATRLGWVGGSSSSGGGGSSGGGSWLGGDILPVVKTGTGTGIGIGHLGESVVGKIRKGATSGGQRRQASSKQRRY